MGNFLTCNNGNKCSYIVDDEDCRHKVLQWVRKNSYKNVVPNMTSSLFYEWVNNELLPNPNLASGFPQ